MEVIGGASGNFAIWTKIGGWRVTTKNLKYKAPLGGSSFLRYRKKKKNSTVQNNNIVYTSSILPATH